MSHAHAAPFLPLVVAVLAAPLAPLASAQLFHASDVRSFGARMLGGGSAAAITRLAGGELTGDERRDAVLLQGADVRLVWGAGQYAALPKVATGATALAYLAPTPPARTGTFLTVGASGLVQHAFDAATGTFTPRPIGTSAWHSARDVAMADLDATGGVDAYALSAAGTSVLQLVAIDTSSPVETSFTLAGAAQGIVALDWSSTPNREIAVSTAAGVEIHRLVGPLVTTLSIAGAGARMAVLPRTPGGYERLACVARSGSNDVLIVAGNGLATTSLSLGDQRVLAIEVGDLDGDGLADLVMSRATSGNPLYLLQQSGGAFAVGGAASGTIDLGVTTASADPAPIAVDDFDSDGDADVLAYVPSELALFLAPNATSDQRAQSPPVVSMQFTEDLSQLTPAPLFSLDFVVEAPQTPLANGTHLEITVWRQAESGSGPAKEAVERLLVAKAAWPVSIHLPFSDVSEASHLFEIESREIALDASGAYVRAGPARLACYSADVELLAEFSAIQSIDFETFVTDVPWIVVWPPGVQGLSSRLDTGIVPLGDVPEFEDDETDPADDDKVPDPKPSG